MPPLRESASTVGKEGWNARVTTIQSSYLRVARILLR